jgi:putative flippase GtrA
VSNALASSSLPRQMLAFAAVGLAATLTHYCVALLAAQSLPVTWANPVGFIVAFFVSYGGHVHFTFQVKGEHRRHRQRLPRFAVTAATGFLIGQAILLVLTRLTDGSDWLVLGLAVGSVPAITFLLSKLWVFRDLRV